jgi:hypothetical protein
MKLLCMHTSMTAYAGCADMCAGSIPWHAGDMQIGASFAQRNTNHLETTPHHHTQHHDEHNTMPP